MHGVNRAVIEAVTAWLNQGHRVWYVTVLATWGASPRPAGSLFAYNQDTGKSVGSLSSGCIEQALIDSWREARAQDFPLQQSFGGTPEERSQFELPCGGTLEVLIENIEAGDQELAHFTALKQALDQRQTIMRCVDLASGVMSIGDALEDTPNVFIDGEQLAHVLGVHRRLLVLGWGDIAQYLVPLVQTLDYEVSICEPRRDVLQRSPILFEDTTSQGQSEQVALRDDILPDDLIRTEFNDPFCAIVALSHDPRVDDLGLIAAAQSEAFYIGALGSVRTAQKRLERLRELGLPEDKLARIHAPVGLDIQSKTPPEIAIAIAAQLVQCARVSHP